jgi:hypothetical protein
MNNIPELKQTALQKLITRFTTAPNLVLTKMFGSDRYESEDIYWEAQIGNRGIMPFAAEDAPAPMIGIEGVSGHQAHAAFWKEKAYLGASFMNNIREPGDSRKHYAATKMLARETNKLRNRCDRRKEWMFCQMLTNGSFTYLDKRGNKVSVDYGIPSTHFPELEAARKWDQDTSKVLEDWFDIVEFFEYHAQAPITHVMVTSEVVRAMVLNKGVQSLLTKSAFGDGDLMTRPAEVLRALLGVQNFMVNNEMYEVRCWMTSALSAGTGPHTIYVDEVKDIAVGDTIYGVRVSDDGGKPTLTEAMTVTATSATAGTITATGTITTALRSQSDYIYTVRKFLPTNRFTVFAETVEGQKLAEFAEAPFDLDRHYGMKVDRNFKWDPDGVFIRVQNKGLPVLFFEDAVYSVEVL